MKKVDSHPPGTILDTIPPIESDRSRPSQLSPRGRHHARESRRDSLHDEKRNRNTKHSLSTPPPLSTPSTTGTPLRCAESNSAHHPNRIPDSGKARRHPPEERRPRRSRSVYFPPLPNRIRSTTEFGAPSGVNQRFRSGVEEIASSALFAAAHPLPSSPVRLSGRGDIGFAAAVGIIPLHLVGAHVFGDD